MKLSNLLLIAAVAGQAAASWGFGKTTYNKWHETELERWLSDHDIPYPKPAERKDLEKIVQDNWQTRIVDSYKNWDAPQLQSYLSDAGKEVDKKQKEDKNWLVQQVKAGWHETEKTAESAFGSIKDWIFDSWTESQLKSFLDRHGIPNPTPRNRDTLLATARNNYQSVADKLGETSAYPGNWLYESWSESDLKRWLDEHGYPAPQPSSRDKLIAAVRRNSRLASVKAAKDKESTKKSVSDAVFNSWSDSKLKEFLDTHNVKVPQGSTRNELIALARRNKAYYSGESAASSISSAASAATSVVGDKASKATDTANYYGQVAFDKVIEQWSDTRLKAYLDSRGVPVPQASKRDELLAKVRLHKHKAATGYGAWTFDTWTKENLRAWLEARGQKVSNNAAASRDQLYASATEYYSSASRSAVSAAAEASKTASKSGYSAGSKITDAAGSAASVAADSVASAASRATDSAASASSVVTDSAASAASAGTEAVTEGSKQAFASLTSALAQATDTAKEVTFDTWSDSDLKAYLDTYNINTYQGTTRNEMIAMARRNAHYFRYGSQDQGVWGQFQATIGYAQDKLGSLLGFGAHQAQKAGDRAYESAQVAADAVKEKATQASNRAKEEL
ncbi:putative MSC1 protein [Tricharina praecox]|uniref:putative MSC1 protein n=1 Tax=Tricharina praecox TaxID=43433 RepID=UPI0022204877|nr:putative MSC1 protein [Tricharina praecox]KAI5858580.1 putative MSC1 protein [Tricharina praecox]